MVELPRSINIYRDRLADLDGSFERLEKEFDRQDINPDHIIWVGKTATRSMILSGGEIEWFLADHRKRTSEEANDTLIAWLYQNMPGSSDTEIAIPTEQIDMHPVVSSPRTQQFSVGGNNRILMNERESAKTYVEEFFDLDGQGKQWPVWGYSPELPLVRVVNPDTAGRVLDILSRYTDIFPGEIALGPVKIEKSAD